MTITLKNFGPIKELTMDLTKNLHLLYGESSVGKSYAAYCAYLLVSKLQEPIIRSGRHILPEDSTVDTTLLAMLNNARIQGQNEVEVGSSEFSSLFLETLAESLQDILAPLFQATFGNRLEELNNEYTHGSFSLLLSTDILELVFSSRHELGPLHLTGFIPKVPIVIRQSQQASPVGGTVTFENGRIVAISQRTFSALLRNYIIQSLGASLQSVSSKMYYLPASRLGLYRMHTSFSPIIAELATRRFDLRRSINLPSLTTPDADYIQQLALIQTHQEVSPLTTLAKHLENDIIKGTIHFEEQTKRIVFQPKDTNIWQDISHVSSMVAALAPLVLYLKYVLTTPRPPQSQYRELQDDASPAEKIAFQKRTIFLIFEEPEAHLHPTAQVKLMEILAELTKYNVRVMLTSHSDFMFSKLGNLVLGDTIDEKDIAVYHLVMTNEGSIDAGDMHITKQEIRETNFADVSEELYDERLELIERLNQQAEVA